MFEKKMTVQISEEDYVHFSRYHMANHPVGKKAFLMHLLMAPLLCLFVVLILVIAKADFDLIVTEAVGLTVLSIIWMAFTKKRLLRRARKSYRKTVKKDPDAFSEAQVTFFDEHFTVVDPKETASIRYGAIKRVGADKNGVYLYKTDILAYVLSAHCFSCPEEQAQLVEFLRKKTEEQRAEK